MGTKHSSLATGITGQGGTRSVSQVCHSCVLLGYFALNPTSLQMGWFLLRLQEIKVLRI